MDLFPSAHPEN